MNMMSTRNYIAMLACLALVVVRAAGADYRITDFGAVADDGRLDSEAIQAAIDAAATAENGGTVTIPRGEFYSGGIRLQSRVTLNLEQGAVLKGSDDHRDYGPGRWLVALISGENLDRIRITGKGTIDGSDCKNPKGEEGFRGPHGILLRNCSNITIDDVTIKRTGNYAILCRDSQKAVIRRVSIRGGHDGLHAQACRDFKVSHCDVRTGDDCFAGCDNTNFEIADCNINSSCNGFRLGCVDLKVKRCRIWGPGEYQHQVSRRKNMLSAFVHFAPRDRNPKLPSDRWLIEDLTIDNVGFVYGYDIEKGLWQKGQPARRLHFRNIKATRVERPIRVVGDSEKQFELMLEDVSISLREDRQDQPVLSVSRFGLLDLHNVTLQNSGQKPVIVARDGRKVSIQGVKHVPDNLKPFDFGQVEQEDLGSQLEDEPAFPPREDSHAVSN